MALIAGAATLPSMPCVGWARQIVGRDLSKPNWAHTVMETAAANAMKLVRLVAVPSQEARIPLYKDIDANKAVLDKALAQSLPLADTRRKPRCWSRLKLRVRRITRFFVDAADLLEGDERAEAQNCWKPAPAGAG